MRSRDDLGNGHRVVDHYNDRLRWIQIANRWAVYTDGRWILEESPLGQGLIQDLIDKLDVLEGPLYGEGEDREKFRKWAREQRSSTKIRAAEYMARGQRQLHARLSDFDTDPWLLNCRNGVVSLVDGSIKPHDPDLLLMHQVNADYDPKAKAPRFDAFLQRVLPDPDMRDYLQRIVGYSITGHIGEQAMFLHYGSGANGKSVFLDVMSAVFGDYGQVVPRQTLLARSADDNVPNDVARMVGKRFLQASETATGRRLDEEMVKSLTGGERVTARFMRGEFFDFKPTGKIHLATNHLPSMSQADSIWRRIHLLEWGVKIPAAERDGALAERIIREEAAGVLVWAAQGALRWRQRRLDPPLDAQARLAQYRDDEDILGAFVESRLITHDETFRSPVQSLYQAYRAWAKDVGIQQPMTEKSFSQAMAERGFQRYRTKTDRGFVGVQVNLRVPIEGWGEQ